MDSPLDIAVVAALFIAALAFVIWRFAVTKKPPACAPDGKAPPQVILGTRLKSGLAQLKNKDKEAR